jgi:hypothetical protein
MPVTVGQITSNVARASFNVTITQEDEEGNEHTYTEKVNLKYYPGRVTERTMALANQFKVGDALDEVLSGFKAFNDEMVRLIKWWDVMENDGVTMFPIETKRLEELSLDFRGQLLVAIVEGISPEALAPHLNGRS